MSDLMMTGFNLAMYGMGFVFTFLILLVFLTVSMSSLIRRYAPVTLLPTKPRLTARKSVAPKSDAGEQARVVAAISAAIRKHRSGDE
jgi:oxaloacetate decarboxylase gamma subunit